MGDKGALISSRQDKKFISGDGENKLFSNSRLQFPSDLSALHWQNLVSTKQKTLDWFWQVIAIIKHTYKNRATKVVFLPVAR